MDHEKVNYVDFFLGATAPEPSSSSGGGAVAATAAVAVEAAIVAAATAEIQREMVERPNFCNEFAVLVSKGACPYQISKLIFAGYTSSKNPVPNTLRIQFVELDFSSLIFQKK